jgi:hypothetical protein
MVTYNNLFEGVGRVFTPILIKIKRYFQNIENYRIASRIFKWQNPEFPRNKRFNPATLIYHVIKQQQINSEMFFYIYMI